jgi:hypothetical protein
MPATVKFFPGAIREVISALAHPSKNNVESLSISLVAGAEALDPRASAVRGIIRMRKSFAVGIGGAAGQGVATPGDIFCKIFSRRGLHLNAYNAYQSIIRGGHTFLTVRTGPDPITNMGDRLDLLIPLNQDTMDRHLSLSPRAAPASSMEIRSNPAPPRPESSSVPFLSPNSLTSRKTK